MSWRTKDKPAGKAARVRYREVVRMLKEYLVPVEPDPGFSGRLEDLCAEMGAGELFRAEWEWGVEKSGRRSIIIGGAICSALPFLGVAAYAIGKHLTRRRVVPLGV
jgi:hypothetical protein